MKKDQFQIPEGVIYMDGNSLGPLPKSVPTRLSQTVHDEWGAMLIKGWNDAGWMDMPTRLGDRIGAMLGCANGSVVLGDTLSIKVYQALAAALNLNPDRRVVLSDNGNFPSDLYMAQGLLNTLNRGHELRVVDPDKVLEHITSDVAVLMLTHIDYRSGRMHDMMALTKAAQDSGVVVIWDLAHSAGAVPVDMGASGAEFAVGCTYKYLNGGPGAPAFIYVRPDLIDRIDPSLSGWLGHDAPFAFELGYRPAGGIDRMRVGTPPILQMAALDAALDVWEGVSMDELRNNSIALSERFISGVEQHCPTLTLASPRDPQLRGSQVSFQCENGYAVMQALIHHGVIGDFRAPDLIRFGFTPLYLDSGDIDQAVDILARIMRDDLWQDAKFQTRSAVT
ncbi:kynureninase [Paramylibacter kogurei]|nr:kynureninase [Amylibacter kogurei]